MARLIVEVVGGPRTQGQYHIFESAEVHVGRGLGNDLILSDPYVSERHLLIARSGDEVVVRDLSSMNGTYLPKTKGRVTEARIGSGNELIIGTTRLRIFTEIHVVPPVRPLHPRNATVRWLRKPLVAWGAAALVTALAVLEGYLGSDTATSALKLLPYAIIALLTILLWSGVWSFVGRLTRHKIRFVIHVSLICVALILSDLIDVVTHCAEFYSSSWVVGVVVSYLGYGVLYIGLLYLSLAFATNMRPRTRLLTSAICVLLILTATAGLTAAYRAYYGGIPYSTTLMPPIWGAPEGQSIEAFLAHTDSVFDFNLKDK